MLTLYFLVCLLFSATLVFADCTPAQLNTELTTDPQTLGYASHIATGNDRAIRDILNTRRAGAPFQINRGVVDAYIVFNTFDDVEFEALTAIQLQRLATLLSAGRVDLNAATVRNILRNAFPAGGNTRAQLVAISARQGSRAEVLCDRQATLADVSLALRNSQ